MRETILRIINASRGITNSNLRLDLMAEYGPTRFDVNEYKKVLEELIEDQKVVRVTFVIPPEHKNKMFVGDLLLPGRSAVFINVKDDGTHYRRQ